MHPASVISGMASEKRKNINNISAPVISEAFDDNIDKHRLRDSLNQYSPDYLFNQIGGNEIVYLGNSVIEA